MVVTWSDDELIFTVTYQPLTKDEVEAEVGEVVSNPPNLQHPEVFHSIPLSPVTLCELNGRQVYSRFSIIMCTNDCYLKYTFNPSETSELFRLMFQASSRQIRDSVSRLLLPKKLEYILRKTFFVYIPLIPPLTREEAMKCLCPFVKSVADAIHSLRMFGYAHLDVRLENICFSTASPHHAILIDLDRCSPVTEPAYSQETYYPSSTMYKSCDEEWKVDQLDWLQFSLMVKFVQDRSITDYHSMAVTSLKEGMLSIISHKFST